MRSQGSKHNRTDSWQNVNCSVDHNPRIDCTYKQNVNAVMLWQVVTATANVTIYGLKVRDNLDISSLSLSRKKLKMGSRNQFFIASYTIRLRSGRSCTHCCMYKSLMNFMVIV